MIPLTEALGPHIMQVSQQFIARWVPHDLIYRTSCNTQKTPQVCYIYFNYGYNDLIGCGLGDVSSRP